MFGDVVFGFAGRIIGRDSGWSGGWNWNLAEFEDFCMASPMDRISTGIVNNKSFLLEGIWLIWVGGLGFLIRVQLGQDLGIWSEDEWGCLGCRRMHESGFLFQLNWSEFLVIFNVKYLASDWKIGVYIGTKLSSYWGTLGGEYLAFFTRFRLSSIW